MQRDIEKSHLELISRIYDLPLNPSRWQEVLDQFALFMEARFAATAVYDPRYAPHHLNATSSNMGKDFFLAQEKHAPKGYRSAFTDMCRNPRRGFIAEKEMFENFDIEEYENRQLVRWLDETYDAFWGASSCLNLERAWNDILFVMYPRSHGPVTTDQKQLGNLFLDHFAKATELGRAFGALQYQFRGMLSALDRFHIGIFLLTDNESVVLKNSEGDRITGEGDGLSISVKGQLTPRGLEERAKLNVAVTHAINTAHAEFNSAETRLTVSRPSGKDPYLIEVSPIRDEIELDGCFKGALVFVIDPSRSDVVSTEGMKEIYNLTEAESQVCKLLADGYETIDIADIREITKETVRYYVKQVLQKTGTSSRAQLVRLALNVNLPIDNSSKNDENAI